MSTYTVDGEPIDPCPVCNQVTDTKDGKFRLHTVGFQPNARNCPGSYKTPEEAKETKKHGTVNWPRRTT